MAFVEEVFKNKGGLFGAHTGRKYEKDEVEDIGGIQWSKGSYQAPGEVVLVMDFDKQPEQPKDCVDE